MKINAPAGPLARMLKIVARAASRTSSIASPQALLIDARDGVLTLEATDTEISARLRAGAAAEEDGTALVGANPTTTILVSMPPGNPVALATTDSEATLTLENASYKLRVHAVKDYPRAAPFPEDDAFSLPLLALRRALAAVTPAASKDQTRAVLTGVKAIFDSGKLTLAATDSYRLAVYAAEVSGGPASRAEALIPARTFTEALNMAALVIADADETTTIEISLTESQACFRCGPLEVSCRLLAGTYPEYERLMPGAFDNEIRLDAATILDSLSRVALFTKGANTASPVTLTFTPADNLLGGNMRVSASDPTSGHAAENIAVAVDAPVAMAFNARYLTEAIRTCAPNGAANGSAKGSSKGSTQPGEIVLKYNDPMKPVVVRPATAEEGSTPPGLSCLVMPMRLPDDETPPDKAPAKEPAQVPAKAPANDPDEPEPANPAKDSASAPDETPHSETEPSPDKQLATV